MTAAHGQKPEGHTGRAHSRIGPSAAHRWLACPGSVQRSAHMPNRDTVFTREGTAAHELCEFIVNTGWEPERFLGGVVDLRGKTTAERLRLKHDLGPLVADSWDVFEIDEDMVDGATLYRDTVRGYLTPGSLIELELRMDMTHVHPKLFGTGDCVIYDPLAKHLVVCDFKYGRGVAVEVKDNEQLLTYAVGASAYFSKRGMIERITLVVVQPRAFHHDGPVRVADVDPIDLVLFEDELRVRAAETDQANATICVGDQCKWCPISHACPELREHVHLVTGARFVGNDITDAAMPNVLRMTPDQLGVVMRQMVVIENWLRAVARHAHDEALAGRVPTGMKTVEKRAYRFWAKPEDEIVLDLELAGVEAEDIFTDPQPELKSVAQVEKVLGKKRAAEVLPGLYTKKSSGIVLALIEDARPAVAVDKSDAFGAVCDD